MRRIQQQQSLNSLDPHRCSLTPSRVIAPVMLCLKGSRQRPSGQVGEYDHGRGTQPPLPLATHVCSKLTKRLPNISRRGGYLHRSFPCLEHSYFGSSLVYLSGSDMIEGDIKCTSLLHARVPTQSAHQQPAKRASNRALLLPRLWDK